MAAEHTCGIPTNEMHQHKCDGCSTVWEHSSSSRKCVACHTCPNPECNGATQYWHHHGQGEMAEVDQAIKELYALLKQW
jgi:hypothetical protein